MKNQTTHDGAATPSVSKYALKHEATLRTNSTLHFQLGLIILLLLSWLVLESTTMVETVNHVRTTNTRDFNEDPTGPITVIPDNPVVAVNTSQPVMPQPSLAPPIIVDNNTPVAIDPVVVQPLAPVVPITGTATVPTLSTHSTLVPATPAVTPTLGMNGVSSIPLFPGCSSKLNSKERMACFNEKIQQHVQRNFDSSIGNRIDDTLIKFTIGFTIDDKGDIINIQVKSKNDLITKEARRVIARLPEMKPGSHNGLPVNVRYVLPIVFQVY